MAVIGLGASLLYATLPNDEDQDPVQEVDYEVELATAGRAAPYPLMAPEGLADSWRATSVTYQGESDHGAVWHLGFVDPSDEYVAVEQGDGKRDKFIAKVTHRANATARTDKINGEEWVRYEGAKYNALVRKDTSYGEDTSDGQSDAAKAAAKSNAAKSDGQPDAADVTTLVTGTASYDQLKKMAAALEPQSNQG